MYVFESKQDLLYFKNREALRKAVEQAGGDGDRFFTIQVEELLDSLTRNSIELEAKYIGKRTELL